MLKAATCMLLFLNAALCNAQSLDVVSGNTNIRFSQNGSAIQLSAIEDVGKQKNFLLPKAGTSDIWRLELRPPDGNSQKVTLITSSTVSAIPVIKNVDSGELRITWKNIDIEQQRAVVDVEVSLKSIKNTSLTDWQISVVNRSSSLGLWEITFPCINVLTVGKDGKAFTPFATGQVDDDPVMTLDFDQIYPQCLYSMQFAGLCETGSCLYLATHDSKAYVKKLRFRGSKDRAKGISYELIQLPEDMGKPGKNYTQPYPCIVGVIVGDDYDAAKLYRKWVLTQSDWMKEKKPLSQRTDIPDWLKTLPFWLGFHYMSEKNIEMIESDIKYMGVPTGVHLYHWHTPAFDTKYPDLWPPLPNTAEYIKRIQAIGGKAMPYTNSRLLDKLCDSWKNDQGEKYVVTDANGSIPTEVYCSGNLAQFTVACPATEYWQQKFDGPYTQIIKTLNPDGIYCDQVGAAKPVLCFNSAHGHPVGGGYHWQSGYNKQIEHNRKTAMKLGKPLFFTCESAAEPYDYDIFLRCNEGAPFLSPSWQYVYSGYRQSFGFYFYEHREWIVKASTQYLWGFQIGWMGQFDRSKFSPEIIPFLREVARARYAGSDYLAMGEMLRPPTVKGEFKRVKTIWRNFQTEIPIDWPAVKATLWKAADGTVGIAVVNMCESLQTAHVEFDRDILDLSNHKLNVKCLYPADGRINGVKDDKAISVEIELKPYSAYLFVVSECK